MDLRAMAVVAAAIIVDRLAPAGASIARAIRSSPMLGTLPFQGGEEAWCS
jgi:hypothetical protein